MWTIEKIKAKNVEVDELTDCWNWTGSFDKDGYGKYGSKTDWVPKSYRASRLFYEQLKEPIPQGKVLDHLCRNRKCVNPEHLEVVTNKENILRGDGLASQNAKKTHCVRNHPLSGNNLLLHDGHRRCKTCQRENEKRAYARRKESVRRNNEGF